MSRTITAMFDSRSEAEAARDRLTSSSIDAQRVRIIDQSSAGQGTSGSSGSGQHEGFWASLKDMFMPDEDRHAYGEGIRRGGYLLIAEVDESEADRVCSVLDQSSSVDLDQRQDEWRSQGWGGYQAGAFGQLSQDRDTGSRLHETSGRDVDEERIPIVEEELRVGKREVERGGARVRSYVREVPVHEQVNLREEHVDIERRPADRAVDAAEGDVFRDREIEMTERAEEAVVSKEAHVREEVVVRKTAEEHIETIDDTVRRTEVDIDENARSDRSAFTDLDRDRERDETTERSDFERSGADRNRDRDSLI
jgi:uncharacterized protein (TIGR02271 family)